jgi:hypothetical protein
MAKAEVSAAETSHGSRLHQAAATILNNTIYSITKHTHQTLEEEQETERRGGDPLLRENIYPARSTNDVTTTRRAPRAGLFTSAARCPVALLQDLESQQQQ